MMLDTESYVSQIQQQGFAVAENCLTAGERDLLLDAIAGIADREDVGIRRRERVYALRNLVQLIPGSCDVMRKADGGQAAPSSAFRTGSRATAHTASLAHVFDVQ